jgi:ABC-type branched-subunit amino acid transport system ATPase component
MLLRPQGLLGNRELDLRRFGCRRREGGVGVSAALDLDNLEMHFGGLRAVGRRELRGARGSIFGLIGPNGAGKTTVFNCVTGVYTPTRGTITFREPIDGVPAWKIADLGIARTFQNIRLFGQMTVLENVLVADHRATRASLFDAICARSATSTTTARCAPRRWSCWLSSASTTTPSARARCPTATSGGWRSPGR